MNLLQNLHIGSRCLVPTLTLILCGCTVGPDFIRPDPPLAKNYSSDVQTSATLSADGVAQRFLPGTEISTQWWRLFKSPPLDAAVSVALRNSPTLQSAEASLRQSYEKLSAGEGVYYPQVDAGLSAMRMRGAPTQQGTASPISVFNVATLNGSVSYSLDFFGGERRMVESLHAQVDYQRYARTAAYLTLSANVVNTCIARAAYSAQIRATEQLTALETEQLRSMENQVRAGFSPYANLLSQRGLIAANEALLAPLKQRLSQTEHLLAQLQGLGPDQAPTPAIELSSLTLPPDIPLTLPSELVRRRPDILLAEAQLHIASANIGVATAAMYPSFNLTATYGTAGSTLGDLLGTGGRFWSIGPSMAASLFHGGSLDAQRRAAIDAFDQQQANYRQTVLTAFSDVADVLTALEHDAETLKAQSDAKDASSEALILLQENYRAGLVAYVDVLTADILDHQATIGHLQALAQRHQDTVALFAAMGGGWHDQAPATGEAP